MIIWKASVLPQSKGVLRSYGPRTDRPFEPPRNRPEDPIEALTDSKEDQTVATTQELAKLAVWPFVNQSINRLTGRLAGGAARALRCGLDASASAILLAEVNPLRLTTKQTIRPKRINRSI